MFNNLINLEDGQILKFSLPITNQRYIDTFSEGIKGERYMLYIEVSVFEETDQNRKKCEAYYTVDGSFLKYYMLECYIPNDVDFLPTLKVMLNEAAEMIDFDKVIDDIIADTTD